MVWPDAHGFLERAETPCGSLRDPQRAPRRLGERRADFRALSSSTACLPSLSPLEPQILVEQGAKGFSFVSRWLLVKCSLRSSVSRVLLQSLAPNSNPRVCQVLWLPSFFPSATHRNMLLASGPREGEMEQQHLEQLGELRTCCRDMPSVPGVFLAKTRPSHLSQTHQQCKNTGGLLCTPNQCKFLAFCAGGPFDHGRSSFLCQARKSVKNPREPPTKQLHYDFLFRFIFWYPRKHICESMRNNKTE